VRLGTLTTGLRLLREAPRISQPFLPHQLQRPLLDQVKRKVLSGRYDVAAFRVLDPIEDHFHVVYLTLGALRFWAAILRVQMVVEVVLTRAPPLATLIGTEEPTREVERLKMPLKVLVPVITLPTYWTNGALRLEGGEG